MANDIKKLLTLDNLAHFKELLALVAITNNYADLDGKPLWVGTKAEYEAQKDDIPDNTLIGIIEEDGSVVKIVSWADGTDAEIKAMIDAADAGLITLSDYWHIGDERTVHLSAMTAGDGLNIAQPEQDVVHVLMDTGENSGYTDVNGNPVNFVWGQKDCLSQNGRMNATSTNAGSWNGCAMRADLNDKYYNALPATYKSCLKQFNVITAQTYNGSTNQTSQDYISLFAEKEIFNKQTWSNATESATLKQIKYYEIAANRAKKANGSNYYWWERSPNSSSADSFCDVDTHGNVNASNASYTYGVAPFGCI